jgi:hypothetical protein
MGAAESRSRFKRAVEQLGGPGPIQAGDLVVWDQLAEEGQGSVQDVFQLLPGAKLRSLREGSPASLAALLCRAVERLCRAADSSCRTAGEQQTVLSCCRLLTRAVPYVLEDPDWRSFFWSRPRGEGEEGAEPLAASLLAALTDLLFCPEFTVCGGGRAAREEVDELRQLDSCEHIWEQGVGFVGTPGQVPSHHHHRTELLRLLLACCSEAIYLEPGQEGASRWIHHLTSPSNRHALPLFTSLLNTVCGYQPSGLLPYNHLLWADSKERLVEVSLQLLVVGLDQEPPDGASNLFLNYVSR